MQPVRRFQKENAKTIVYRIICFGVLAVFLIGFIPISAAATEEITIVSNYADLRSTMEQAVNGDTIGIDGAIFINDGSETFGYGDKHITIQRVSEDACIEVDQGGAVTICNITFDGDKESFEYGTVLVPAFRIRSNANFEGVTIKNCLAGTWGTAIQVHSGTVNINNCTLTNNRSLSSGGHIAMINDAVVNIHNSILTYGSATNMGGAISNETNVGILNIVSSTISQNTAEYYGGAIRNHGVLTATDSLFYANEADIGKDFANAIGSTIQIAPISELVSTYEKVGIKPIEWGTEDGSARQHGGYTYTFMTLIYEEITKEEPTEPEATIPNVTVPDEYEPPIPETTIPVTEPTKTPTQSTEPEKQQTVVNHYYYQTYTGTPNNPVETVNIPPTTEPTIATEETTVPTTEATIELTETTIPTESTIAVAEAAMLFDNPDTGDISMDNESEEPDWIEIIVPIKFIEILLLTGIFIMQALEYRITYRGRYQK